MRFGDKISFEGMNYIATAPVSRWGALHEKYLLFDANQPRVSLNQGNMKAIILTSHTLSNRRSSSRLVTSTYLTLHHYIDSWWPSNVIYEFYNLGIYTFSAVTTLKIFHHKRYFYHDKSHISHNKNLHFVDKSSLLAFRYWRCNIAGDYCTNTINNEIGIGWTPLSKILVNQLMIRQRCQVLIKYRY